jgi:hypothetical protein
MHVCCSHMALIEPGNQVHQFTLSCMHVRWAKMAAKECVRVALEKATQMLSWKVIISVSDFFCLLAKLKWLREFDLEINLL